VANIKAEYDFLNVAKSKFKKNSICQTFVYLALELGIYFVKLEKKRKKQINKHYMM